MPWISKSMCCKNRPNTKKSAVQLMNHCFEFFSICIICWSMLVGLCMFLELTMCVMLPCVSLLCLSTDLWRWHFFLLHFTPTVITIEFDDVLHEVLFCCFCCFVRFRFCLWHLGMVWWHIMACLAGLITYSMCPTLSLAFYLQKPAASPHLWQCRMSRILQIPDGFLLASALW